MSKNYKLNMLISVLMAISLFILLLATNVNVNIRVLMTNTSISIGLGGFLIYFANSYISYIKAKRLRYALFSEMGCIARAVFYALSFDEINLSKMKETFYVKNAVFHNMGYNIALLDKKDAKDVLQFHSIMMVIYNLICNGESSERVEEAIKELAKITNENGVVLQMVKESTHSLNGLKKYLDVKENN